MYVKIASNIHILYCTKRHYWATLWLVVNNSVILDTIARLSNNEKSITYTTCMHKNNSASLNNTTMWHYLGTNHLDSRHKSNSTPRVLN